MKNLEQIRANNALQAITKYNFKGQNNGDIIKKVPPLIQQDGLLATVAFAMENGSGYASTLSASLDHYRSLHTELNNIQDLRAFNAWLCTCDSAVLREVTAEILAYLNYLRRYAKIDK